MCPKQPFDHLDLTPLQRAELERCWDEHQRHPGEGEPWEVVEAEILQGIGKFSPAADPADWPLTEALRNELDRRLEEDERDPDGGRDWADIREELLQRVARRRASAA